MKVLKWIGYHLRGMVACKRAQDALFDVDCVDIFVGWVEDIDNLPIALMEKREPFRELELSFKRERETFLIICSFSSASDFFPCLFIPNGFTYFAKALPIKRRERESAQNMRNRISNQWQILEGDDCVPEHSPSIEQVGVGLAHKESP